MERMEIRDNDNIERKIIGGVLQNVQKAVCVSKLSTMARVEIAIKEQPEFGVLRAKLLEHGGIEVVPPCEWNNDLRQYVIGRDPDLFALLERGDLMTGPIACRSRGMERNRCHENIARLWLQNRKRDALVGIGTGYCLSQGLWIQHSWGVRKDSLLETVGQRDKYFGIRLEGVDADVFAFKILAVEVTNWDLFSVDFVMRVHAEMERRIVVEAASSL